MPRRCGRLGVAEVERRYLVYAPAALPARPVPVVFVFPGYSASAEAAAFYYTHTRWEALADRDGFVVVYGNGLPHPPDARERPAMPKGGFLQGCLAEHAGEGIDVAYVRHIVEQLGTELALDRTRIYATGLSAGGGMAFELALEAPDLVAAIAPVAPLPFQPTGPWLHGCHPRPGHERVSIAMLAATDDPFISYAPGSSREYPAARYPGMEETRAAWLDGARDRGRAAHRRLPRRRAGRFLSAANRPREQHDRAATLRAGGRRTRAVVLQGGRHGALLAKPDPDMERPVGALRENQPGHRLHR